jgi:hypothetical protein
LSNLDIGQAVYFQHQAGRNWKLEEIQNIHGQRTYIVKDQNGTIYRRNRIHMRPTKVNFHHRDHSPTRLTLTDQSRIKTSHYVSDPKVVNQPIPLLSETEPEVLSVIPLEPSARDEVHE